MTLMIGIFQFHGNSERKQVKKKQTKKPRDICQSGSIFLNLQGIAVFD